MKEGWEYKTIKECCAILDSKRKPITKSKREAGTIPYYGATGLLDYVKDYIFDEPLVLLGEDGAKWGAGETSAFRIEGKSWVNNHAHTLRPNRDLINDSWLTYFLNYSNLQEYITGVTVPKLNQEKMSKIAVPIPPLSEQQHIVDYLDNAFANIDRIKANASTALDEAKVLFQAALDEAMTPKDGWQEKTLRDIGKTSTGTTPSKAEKDNYGYDMPFIRPSEINYDGVGGILYDSEIKLSPKGVSKGRVFEAHSILMVCIGTIGKVGYSYKKISCNQQINVLTPNGIHCSKYIYYAMLASNFNKKVIKEGASAQATLPIINKSKWEMLTIFVPPLSEQRSIANRLDILSEKVGKIKENFRTVVTECDALKQAILKQVFE